MNPVFDDASRWSSVRAIRSARHVLFVCPRFPVTYWSQHFPFRDILGDPEKAFQPPLDMLTVAAFFPESWSLRLADENARPVNDDDLRWADIVVTGANRVQMDSLDALIERAHAFGKPVVLGGLDPSMRPHFYDTADYLHVGLVGDATRDMILALDQAHDRPIAQQVFTVERKLHMEDYPPPRYDLIAPGDYLALSLQYAVGCPFLCEFCEIAPFYGRKPMVKRPEQLTRELDRILATGYRGVLVFVDDNFIGNPQAAARTVSVLGEWQREHGRPFQFFASASANLAEHPELMDSMYAAGFFAVFVGIETPNAKDLKAISKTQNTSRSTLDIVAAIHAHRLQVYGAFVLGFDTEGADAGENIFQFVESANICTPILSLLTASQGTPLYNRLRAEGRLIVQSRKGAFLDSNVLYARGQPEVFGQYVETYNRIYNPHNFFRRVKRNILETRVDDRRFNNTLPFRLKLKALPRMIWHMGLRPAWRREFWKMALWSLAHGKFNYFAYIAFMGYHYIRFSQALADAPPVPVTAETVAAVADVSARDAGAIDYARAKDGPMLFSGGLHPEENRQNVRAEHTSDIGPALEPVRI